MIRDFDMKDLEHFEPNDMSAPHDVTAIMQDDRWWNYTLINSGIVKAVISFTEEKEDEWAVFCLISKHFNARDSVELRRFEKRAMEALKPKRLWTISRPIETVNKWHRFLGLMFEKPIQLNGETYNMWQRVIL